MTVILENNGENILEVKNMIHRFPTQRWGNGARTLFNVPYLLVKNKGLYALVGANGSGKSTFLRCLLSLVKPSQGTVSWWGGAGPEVWGRKLGYVPEFPIFTFPCSVKTWLAQWVGGVGRLLQLHDQMKNLYPKLLNLDSLWEVSMTGLSKGQRQRVQLWLACAHGPQVLVLDEPFSGLDPWAKQELSSFLIDQINNKVTVILATHEITQNLAAVCGSTWVIQEKGEFKETIGYGAPV